MAEETEASVDAKLKKEEEMREGHHKTRHPY
jgi:hypothetical protein